MKKILLVITMFALIGLSANAQITFQKTYGGGNDDIGCSAQQTTDGGYVIVSYEYSYGAGNINVYLIKTNAIGDTLWTKTYGGTSGTGENEAFTVQQTNDGGYIIEGMTSASVTLSADVYLIKTNSIGDTLWTRTYGGINDEYGSSAMQTFDGGYIVCGLTFTYGTGDDAYLIKTNSTGDTMWTKTYGGQVGQGNDAIQTSDTGYIVLAAGLNLIKTNSTGAVTWSKAYGGAVDDEGYRVRQTTDGGYVVVGITASFGAGMQDVYLVKTDSAGDTLWSRTYGGIANEWGNDVQQTTDGGYIVVGGTRSFKGADTSLQVYLIKTDSHGDTLWTRIYGGAGEDIGESVRQTSDGGYIITGSTNSFGAGGYDVYLIKTDSNGNSGCYQGYPATIVTKPHTIINNMSPQVNSGGIVGSTQSIIENGGIITDICFSAGIEEIANNNSISLYPNPTSGTFTLSQLGIRNYELGIYDVLGQQVYTQLITNPNQTTINVSNLSNGVYFYQLTNNAETYRGKFVKQ